MTKLTLVLIVVLTLLSILDGYSLQHTRRCRASGLNSLSMTVGEKLTANGAVGKKEGK